MKKLIKIGMVMVIMMSTLTGCVSREEVAIQFVQLTRYYPTENILDIVKSSAYATSGTLILNSDVSYYVSGNLYVETMLLYIDVEMMECTGKYIVDYYGTEEAEKTIERKHTIEYALYYDEEGYHLIDEVKDEELKDRILNFKFLFQYVDFGDKYFESMKIEYARHNSATDSYSIKYYVPEGDKNVETIYNHIPNLPKSDNITIEFSTDLGMKMLFNDDDKTTIRENITYQTYKWKH